MDEEYECDKENIEKKGMNVPNGIIDNPKLYSLVLCHVNKRHI